MFIYSVRDGFFLYWFRAIVDGIRDLGDILRTRKTVRKETMKLIKSIDRNRPPLKYLIKKRIFRRGIGL